MIDAEQDKIWRAKTGDPNALCTAVSQQGPRFKAYTGSRIWP